VAKKWRESARFDQTVRLKSGIPRVLIKPCVVEPLQREQSGMDEAPNGTPAAKN
jgi:hypothetical protein